MQPEHFMPHSVNSELSLKNLVAVMTEKKLRRRPKSILNPHKL